MKLFKTDDWCEEMRSVIFFHFPTFEEPPEVYCGTPFDSDFDTKYTHFMIVSFNPIFEQAEKDFKETKSSKPLDLKITCPRGCGLVNGGNWCDNINCIPF